MKDLKSQCPLSKIFRLNKPKFVELNFGKLTTNQILKQHGNPVMRVRAIHTCFKEKHLRKLFHFFFLFLNNVFSGSREIYTILKKAFTKWIEASCCCSIAY